MIVVFTTPAMGHVKPMLPLIAGLVRDGHALTCFGHPNFEGVICAMGAAFAPYPPIDYDIDAPDFNLVRMAADLIDASETITRDLMPTVSALAPTLIVQDFMALWGSRIGTALGVPRVHTVPTLVFNRETQGEMRREDGPAKLASDVARGLPALVRAKLRSRFAVSVNEAFGLDGAWRNLAPPVCELVFCLEALQFGERHGEVPRHYIGPTFAPRPPSAADSSSVADGPSGHVLVTFGTLSNNETMRFEAAMQGAMMAGHPVVAQCGGKVDIARLERFARALEDRHPNQTATVIESVDDLETLIAGARLVIHHAGMATTFETVRHAKPALFIPTIADQKVLAGQLDAAGFGVRLAAGRECDASAIAHGLARLQARALDWDAIRDLLARAGGTERGLAVIDEVLGTLPGVGARSGAGAKAGAGA